MNIFKTLFFDPLFKVLLFFYENVPGGLGVAVILLTISVKILLFPLNRKAIRSQKKMKKIQPELEEVRNNHEGDREKIARKTMEVYQEAGINPLSSFILLLAQTPILFALYRVFRKVPARESVNSLFLGIDLSTSSLYLAAAAGFLMLVQMKVSSPPSGGGEGPAQALQSQMKFVFPLVLVFILARVPAAIPLYILVSTLFRIGEHLVTS